MLTNIQCVLKAANLNLDNVIKTTVFLKNMKDYLVMNEIYSQFFSKNKPTRSTVEVVNLPKGALIEIEVIAHC